MPVRLALLESQVDCIVAEPLAHLVDGIPEARTLRLTEWQLHLGVTLHEVRQRHTKQAYLRAARVRGSQQATHATEDLSFGVRGAAEQGESHQARGNGPKQVPEYILSMSHLPASVG